MPYVVGVIIRSNLLKRVVHKSPTLFRVLACGESRCSVVRDPVLVDCDTLFLLSVYSIFFAFKSLRSLIALYTIICVSVVNCEASQLCDVRDLSLHSSCICCTFALCPRCRLITLALSMLCKALFFRLKQLSRNF